MLGYGQSIEKTSTATDFVCQYHGAFSGIVKDIRGFAYFEHHGLMPISNTVNYQQFTVIR
ncbi:hypothetical protein C3B55_00779 [Candidatus Pseudomonas adelgestsugas]|uniref:Uncharacterized protein n=1 Tax=Candidatus Pseudomonas adelgestsugas TaxID=1302376 RepID=A0ABX5R8X9_9PSED|nr:hypothetical protein C3B55_00779 [Candidatus Pseudomonas adelgestsugas]